jgi:hypothetical protein
MARFHGHPSAPIAHEFHGGKLVYAYMFDVRGRSTTEAALALVSAGIAQVPGLIGHGTTGFAGICHNRPPSFFDVQSTLGSQINADSKADRLLIN